MYEKNYRVIIMDENKREEQDVTVCYDIEVDSTILNIKAICMSVQALLYDAIHAHDWMLVELCESALESIESVNYTVENDIITVYA